MMRFSFAVLLAVASAISARAGVVSPASPGAPRWPGAVGAFFASPAPDFRTLGGLTAALRAADTSDLALFSPIALAIQTEAEKILAVAPSAETPKAALRAASKKIHWLNDPAVRPLLRKDQRERVAAAAWTHNELIFSKAKTIAAELGTETRLPQERVENPAVIRVIDGDARDVTADALITAIDRAGLCNGGVNAMLTCVGGPRLRKRVTDAKPLSDGMTVLSSIPQGKAGFKNAVLVVDERRRPLREVVLDGLRAAQAAGHDSAILPALRTGFVLGAVEKTLSAIVAELAAGARQFAEYEAKGLRKITIVVYKNKTLAQRLRRALRRRS